MTLIIDGLANLLVLGLGAAVGSFLNVVIYRIPAGLSLIYPPSRCPACLTRLRPQDNIPVLGWLVLRGQCRYCQAPISPRYPLLEFGVALKFLAVFLLFGWQWQTLANWIFLSWLVALALIDLDTLTLPHVLTKWGVMTGIMAQIFLAWADQGTVVACLSALTNSVISVVLGLWLFDLIRWGGAVILQQEVMGGGDGKLAAMIGAWLGWKLLLLTCFLASAMGAVVGLAGIGLGVLGRRQPMPFGPFLALGAAIAALFGQTMIGAYFRWIGLTA
ncbi:prepilin peptidase [Thermosynechococcaceae cyanobacterium BACA0444]|uniref:Prepilin leader peptidase/N-methyltransferase n=1 Tax=Pseudocalidococcus azoricus BACA0444 TaxID=2918990 RepID=A0AAE4FQ31_9CYAN|nr:prepilin peptidase [Pseudocalidococcus azoricus]MDS3860056.1 prepilin peptidase [Pseudocalidococcus azoricus BACA0444]